MDTNSQECAYIWGGGYTLHSWSCIGLNDSSRLERLDQTSRDIVLNVSVSSRDHHSSVSVLSRSRHSEVSVLSRSQHHTFRLQPCYQKVIFEICMFLKLLCQKNRPRQIGPTHMRPSNAQNVYCTRSVRCLLVTHSDFAISTNHRWQYLTHLSRMRQILQ